MVINYKTIQNLLKMGCTIDHIPKVTDEYNAKEAINELSYMAISDSVFLLEEIIKTSNGSMTMLAMAILFAEAPDDFLDGEAVKIAIGQIFLDKNPDKLLEFTEYLKSKTCFFGSAILPNITYFVVAKYSDHLFK